MPISNERERENEQTPAAALSPSTQEKHHLPERYAQRHSVLCQVSSKRVAHLSQLAPRSILPVPDIAQARKEEGSNRTHKERFPSFIRGTIPTHVADTFVAMVAAVWMRTGDIQENLAQATSRALYLSPVIRLHASSSDP